MELKVIETTQAYGAEITTSLQNIWNHVGIEPQKIVQAIVGQGENPCGSQIWEYIGVDGNPETEFLLRIVYPVDKELKKTDGYQPIKMSAFKCICYVHKGPWAEFSDVYKMLMDAIAKQGHQITGVSREVYVQCDFEEPKNCITEIQVGIN